MHWRQHDIGSVLRTFNAFDPTEFSTADNEGSEQNGPALDRRYTSTATGGTAFFMSAKVSVPWFGETFTSGTTANIAWNLQHSSVSTGGWEDFDAADGSTGQTITFSSASTRGTDSADFDLSSAKRYVRVQVTPGASSGDSYDFAAVAVMGGGSQNPPQ